MLTGTFFQPLVQLAYWCREWNVHKIEEYEFESRTDSELVLSDDSWEYIDCFVPGNQSFSWNIAH
jgi:hypothetical protein